MRLYKRNATYVHEAIDIFGITDNLDVQFVMGKPSVHELSGKVYHVSSNRCVPRRQQDKGAVPVYTPVA